MEAEGTAFQYLVNSVFQAKFPSFIPIAPWGADGDRGNDGYIPGSNHYLQVYGPQPNSSWNPVKAAQKAATDFSKLIQAHSINRYSFVLNERYKGVPAPVARALQEIGQIHRIDTDPIAAAHLTDLFMELQEDRKQEIVGGIPSDPPEWIDSSALGELLLHLSLSETSIAQNPKSRAPSFDIKISFNGLDGVIAERLRFHSHQISLVEEFLRSRELWAGQSIAGTLIRLYDESLKTIQNDVIEAPSCRYVWMVEKMLPPKAHAHPYSLKAFRQAAEVVLAKYFEACNVYQEPPPGYRPS